jgi:HD-like signal output (HDOD) protein
LQPPVCLGMVRHMGTVRRACMRLGLAATASLLLSLVVMMLLVETPQIARWFLASAALAGLSYGAALLAAHFEQ